MTTVGHLSHYERGRRLRILAEFERAVAEAAHIGAIGPGDIPAVVDRYNRRRRALGELLGLRLRDRERLSSGLLLR